jgi:general secretion pathway protein G
MGTVSLQAFLRNLRGMVSRRGTRTFRTTLKVLAVVAVVACLVVGAVMFWPRVLDGGDWGKVSVRNDLWQMPQAVQAFQTKNGVDYLPSAIILCEDVNDYYDGDHFKSPLHQESYQYLSRVWPRLQWRDANGQPLRKHWSHVAGYSAVAILEGEQCLVFFTGGIPAQDAAGNPATLGFSTNPYDPTDDGTERVSFYEYTPSLLIQPDVPEAQGYWAYLDGYGKKPYAYFSHYKTVNGYNHVSKVTGKSDCASLKVWPYAEVWNGPNASDNRYLNPDSFQIISAGRDGLFGPGTTSVQSTFRPGITSLPGDHPGHDDLSSFYDRFLGLPAR